MLVPLASLTTLQVLLRSALLPTTSLMLEASGIVRLTSLALVVTLGRVLPSPPTTRAIWASIAPVSAQPATAASVTTASPYAASLLPK